MKQPNAFNPEYQTRGALLVGSVIPKKDITTGERLGVMPENKTRFLDLANRFRLRSHVDGWFIDGKGHRSQIWEFGVAKLGLTVVGSRFIRKCTLARDWLHKQTIGDHEANFWCDWSTDNLAKLSALVGLQRRKGRL